MYHPAILLITAVRAVQLAVTSYMGWNKGLEVKLYKHKHEILRFFSFVGIFTLSLTSFPWERNEHLSKQTPRLDRRRAGSNWSNKPEITCRR